MVLPTGLANWSFCFLRNLAVSWGYVSNTESNHFSKMACFFSNRSSFKLIILCENDTHPPRSNGLFIVAYLFFIWFKDGTPNEISQGHQTLNIIFETTRNLLALEVLRIYMPVLQVRPGRVRRGILCYLSPGP